MRILLADDQAEVRSGLKVLLEQESELSVIGEAEGLSSLLVNAKEKTPDVVLLDWELPNMRVSDIVPILRLLCPGLKIIALSGRPESSKTALEAGVDAFVSKGEQPEKLLDAIRDIKEKQLQA